LSYEGGQHIEIAALMKDHQRFETIQLWISILSRAWASVKPPAFCEYNAKVLATF
jgi:hypothetical protein